MSADYRIEFTEDWQPRTTREDDPRLVGEVRWTWLIPRLHAVLAAPGSEHSWPWYDETTELFDACAYWETAYYLLRTLLGWADLGLGLQRVYQRPELVAASRELSLLHAVWHDRGQLDLLALWAWEHGPRPSSSPSRRRAQEFAGEDWLNGVERRLRSPFLRGHNPWRDGLNPLHLGHSDGVSTLHPDSPKPVVLRSSPAERHAVVMLERAEGWLGALSQLELPNLGERSWHVDVVVRPIGWLGTFRKSRETGRWFVGAHSIHLLGAEADRMHRVPNRKLVAARIPPDDAPWSLIAKFALTFDGYRAFGGECGAMANRRSPRSLSELRACLFFEQRRWYHFGESPHREELDYIRSLVARIRAKVEAGELE